MRLFAILIFMFLMSGCNDRGRDDSEGQPVEKGRDKIELIGSWKWVKSAFHNQDSSFVWTNIDGSLIITENDYSMMFVDQDGPRKPLKMLGWRNNTKEDLENALKNFIANSGHYTIKADTLYLFREIAIWPNNMLKENQPARRGIEWKDDTLILLTKNSREYWIKRN